MIEDDSLDFEPEIIEKLEDLRARLSDILYNIADDFSESNEAIATSEDVYQEEIPQQEASQQDNSELPDTREIDESIKKQFSELDENFMYLGVLKNMSLPEATQLFEGKSEEILKLSKLVWEKEKYPEYNKVFELLGEDYEKITKMLHASDALDPIYENLRIVHENLEEMRDKKIALEKGKEKVTELIKKRKS